MHVDTSIELGRDDPALEFPWASENGSLRYTDLKSDPELIGEIAEAEHYPELRDFLLRVNAPEFALQTAKADIWTTNEIPSEEEIFAARQKLVSYVDLIFSAKELRLSLESHLQLIEKLCALLKRAPDMAASIEFVVRCCYYHNFEDAMSTRQSDTRTRYSAEKVSNIEQGQDSHSGFCITAYVSGFGDTDQETRQRWSIALKLVQHALIQAVRSEVL
jgi:hypothetical protein